MLRWCGRLGAQWMGLRSAGLVGCSPAAHWGRRGCGRKEACWCGFIGPWQKFWAQEVCGTGCLGFRFEGLLVGVGCVGVNERVVLQRRYSFVIQAVQVGIVFEGIQRADEMGMPQNAVVLQIWLNGTYA